MREQSAGGHIFNMDGAGADGGATPRFAAYGATKRSLAQLSKSLQVCSCVFRMERGRSMYVAVALTWRQQSIGIAAWTCMLPAVGRKQGLSAV